MSGYATPKTRRNHDLGVYTLRVLKLIEFVKGSKVFIIILQFFYHVAKGSVKKYF